MHSSRDQWDSRCHSVNNQLKLQTAKLSQLYIKMLNAVHARLLGKWGRAGHSLLVTGARRYTDRLNIKKL